MIDERTDRELIAAHVAGEPDAFATLFARHQDRLWAVAMRTTSDPEEAADGLQDAMISAFRNAAAYRGDAAVTTWLHRIVVNACLDRLRRRRSRPTVPLPGTDPERGEDTLADPVDDIGTAELRHELSRALAELPEDQRMAIVLVDVNGFPVAEAADVLGVPTGTIKSRCARGRAKLAARLAPLRPGRVAAPAGAAAPAPAPAPGATDPSDTSGNPGDTSGKGRNALVPTSVSPEDKPAGDDGAHHSTTAAGGDDTHGR